MSIVIKRKGGELIWFDAITNFSRSFSGSVSKHPIESGSSITDHTTEENIILNLSGVISNSDFHFNRTNLSAEQKQFFNTQGGFYGTSPVAQEPIIGRTGDSFLSRLPESISQYGSTPLPSVEVIPQRSTNFVFTMETMLRDMQRNRELFELLDLDRRIYTNCIMTSLDFTEDPESGDALYPVIVIEVIKFVERVTTTIPPNVIEEIEAQAAAKENKGKQESEKPSNQGPGNTISFDALGFVAGDGNSSGPSFMESLMNVTGG